MFGKAPEILIAHLLAARGAYLDRPLFRIARNANLQDLLNSLPLKAVLTKCQFTLSMLFNVNGSLGKSGFVSGHGINAHRLIPVSLAFPMTRQLQKGDRIIKKSYAGARLVQDPRFAVIRELEARPLPPTIASHQRRLNGHPINHAGMVCRQHQQHVLHAFQTLQIDALPRANLHRTRHARVICNTCEMVEFCLQRILLTVCQPGQKLFD